MRPPGSRRRWMRWAALGVAALVLLAAGTGWALYTRLIGNIRSDSDTQNELERYEAERPDPGPPNVENILLIGSDTRGDGNGEYGADSGTQRSDTTILLHLAANRKSATAVSIPRDLMVQAPHCKRSDGKEIDTQTVQFNWAFQFAGAACTIRTVERMTGIRITHHMIIDFVGFKKMVDAVNGVEVCLPRAINDPAAHLVLPPGRQTLHGEAALGYVRARKSLGNGSDTQRMERQQEFLGALVKKVKSNGVLLNPTRMYPLLDAATSSLTTDEDLASLTGLYELVRSMRGIPTGRIQFLTVPRTEYRYDASRDELVQPAAERLFGQLRRDLPVKVGPAKDARDVTTPSSDGKAARSRPPSEGSDPTFPGTTAERGICE
nr:LCP family protein [Streptomyces piniterrae]